MGGTPVFNKTKPYGEVWGLHNAKYYQDGVYFDASGNVVNIGSGGATAPAPQETQKARETQKVPATQETQELSETPVQKKRGRKKKDTTPDAEIKRKVEAAGGVFTTREAGLEFLKGL